MNDDPDPEFSPENLLYGDPPPWDFDPMEREPDQVPDPC